MYDWMHVIFVNGCFNHTVGLFMWHMRTTSFTYASVHSYLQQWRWPHAARGATGVDSFSSARKDAQLKARVHKCDASEGRSILPVLSHFVSRAIVDRPDALPQHKELAAPIIRMAAIVQELEAAQRGACDPDRLQRHSNGFMETFVRLLNIFLCKRMGR